jgi:hypothetical protein
MAPETVRRTLALLYVQAADELGERERLEALAALGVLGGTAAPRAQRAKALKVAEPLLERVSELLQACCEMHEGTTAQVQHEAAGVARVA